MSINLMSPSHGVTPVIPQAKPYKLQVPGFLQNLTGRTQVKNMPGDMVADVLKAADPATVRQSTARLSVPGLSTAQAEANQKFEATMIRSLTEDMMPDKASSLYGEGTAANIWRSLQIDLMSDAIAKAGGIGIAEKLSRSQTASVSAKTLALNEISSLGGDESGMVPTQEWPYFQRAGQVE